MKNKLEWLDKHKVLSMVILAVLILIIIPIVLNFILTTPSNIGIVAPIHTNAWIGYYGAVLGGLLTLLGVWVTIQFQKESNKKEKAIQFKPILDIANGSNIPKLLPTREVGLNVPGISNNSTDCTPKYILLNEKSKETFYITFQNKGRGETSNAILTSFQAVFDNLNWTDKDKLHPSHSNQSIGEIISNDHLKVVIKLPQYLLIKKDVDLNKELFLDTVMELHYEDMFQENKYIYKVHIKFSIRLDKSYSEDVTLDYRAVKASYSIAQIMPDKKMKKK